MRVGIICEGPTDYVVLRLICSTLLGSDGLIVSLLQPSTDALKRPATSESRVATVPGPGWQGVRAFLRQQGPKLGAAPLE